MIFNNTIKKFIDKEDSAAKFIKDIKKYDVLTDREERDLIVKAQNGDDSAREKLILCNQKFVLKVAKQYSNSNNLNDLIQEGNMGLMTAIDTFDISMDNKFLSYAVWYIRRSIVSFITNDDVLLTKSNNTKLMYKVNKIKKEFIDKNNRQPEYFEIKEILKEKYGIDVKEDCDLFDMSFNSIDSTFDMDDDKAFENSAIFNSYTSTENEIIDEMDVESNKEYIKSLLGCLKEKERVVLSMAYGIGYYKEFTNYEIGQELGYSSERVRQIKNEAIAKLGKIAKKYAY